ncbi:MAG: hypothetical protein ISS01_02485 [Nanoarchaeota archaeon]|nr:hypothetical protein [Nanoarchaeota archaeon]
MYFAQLQLPKGKTPSDLEKLVTSFLKEIEAKIIQDNIIGIQNHRFYEILNKGAIHYIHSQRGNDIHIHLHIETEGEERTHKETYSAGFLCLLGFDETTEYYANLKSKLDLTLDSYLIKQALPYIKQMPSVMIRDN